LTSLRLSSLRLSSLRLTSLRLTGPGLAVLVAALTLAPGAASAATPPVLYSGSASAKLTQVSARDWTTTVYLDTAALCQGTPAFNLITTTPDSDSRDWQPSYPGKLRCDAEISHPVTEVQLTFTPTPRLSAVPQTATLTVTPAQSQLLASDPPLQIPLTIRRIVSGWQYLWIPAIFGGVFTLLFLALLAAIGVPGNARGSREHWGGKFLNSSLFAASTWSFGDSWATSVTPLTALAGGLLTASGTVAGLVPGVDLGRFGLLMAVVGAATVLAPLLFGALNWLFPLHQLDAQALGRGGSAPQDPGQAIGDPRNGSPQGNGAAPPPGEVAEARLWVMVLASCLTVFAVGAELGIVGWVLGYDLVVASPMVRWCAPVAAILTGLLFLGYGVHSILALASQPNGSPKRTAKARSFML
jgi:hypothetical protein